MITETIENIKEMIANRNLPRNGSVEIMIYDDGSVDFMLAGNAKYNYYAVAWKALDENFDVEKFVRNAMSAF